MDDQGISRFTYKSRSEYIKSQIQRSRQKAEYCKVYYSDVLRYQELLSADVARQDTARKGQTFFRPNKILCLGVRGGAEVDIFRTVFFAPLLRVSWIRRFAQRADNSQHAAEKSKLSERFSLGGPARRDRTVLGVEINPDIERPDVYNCSFDELPDEWEDSFDLIYSNSFDHAIEPEKTINEWKRVIRPGGYAIVAFGLSYEQSQTDPLGGLTIRTVQDLLLAPLVFASETLNKTGYAEVCVRV